MGNESVLQFEMYLLAEF